MATGSLFDDVEEGGVSFKIGQANNAALYPGLGLGAIVCRAAKVTDEMILAAAKAVGGQAALFLSRSSAEVHIIIRGETLDTSMSRYLIDQIERDPRISVTPRTQVTALLGTDQLEGVQLLDTSRQQTSALAVRGLFVFIGARPATRWLAGQLAQDNRGFLLTGTSIPQAQLDDPSRMPLFLETSRPGVFAVGDVRSGSVKRAATAIGEGSMAVRLVFERLQATGSAVADPPRADGTGRRPTPAEATPAGSRQRVHPRLPRAEQLS